MARPVYQYKPNNDTPDIALGIFIPFNKNARSKSPSSDYASGSSTGNGVFESTYTTKDSAISNFKNLILTQKGERYMQPEFGTNIRKILFENNVKEIRDILQDDLEADINHWLPYITLNDVIVEPSKDMHSINIQLKFKITSIGMNMVINILANENSFIVDNAEEDIIPLTLQQIGTF